VRDISEHAGYAEKPAEIVTTTNYRLNGERPFDANWFAKLENAPESRVRRPNLVDAVIADLIAVFVLEERRI
jgi:hypothetical protein